MNVETIGHELPEREAKISRGSWSMAVGLERPATLDQAIRVLGAFGYDGIELAGFCDHATLDRYPTRASRLELADQLRSEGLEPVVLAPAAPDAMMYAPWATEDESVLTRYLEFFERFLEFAVDLGVGAIRVDPGSEGPLPPGSLYDAAWERVVTVFTDHAERGAAAGCRILWELEAVQLFNKPTEVVRMLEAVDHPNFQLLYDTGHVQACAVIGHNQSLPRETLPGGQLEFIASVSGRIGHVHLSDTDMNICRGLFGTKIGFGRGIVDFDELVPALARAYDGLWWCADSIPLSSDAWADSWDDIATLRGLLDRHVIGVSEGLGGGAGAPGGPEAVSV